MTGRVVPLMSSARSSGTIRTRLAAGLRAPANNGADTPPTDHERYGAGRRVPLMSVVPSIGTPRSRAVQVRVTGVGMGPHHVTAEAAEAIRSCGYVLAADKALASMFRESG